MSTRRKLLLDGLRAAPVAMLALSGAGCVHQAQAGPGTSPPAGGGVGDGTGDITGHASLKFHGHAHHLFIGAAVDVDVLKKDVTYRRVLAEQFNMVVAEREMKWKTLRPTASTYSFTLADELMAFAHERKMRVRGHNFVWHEALPDWFASTVTKANAEQILVDHILTVGRRYQGRVHSWDVVNEAVLPKDGRADGLRNSPWMALLGPEYIDIAFRAARRADPKALLTYNDYGLEYDNEEDGARREVTLQLLQRLQKANVPLDAVGLQAHIKANSQYSIGKGLREFMASVRRMGLQIFITELDVNEDDIASNDIAERDRIIAETYRQFLSVALAEPAVRALLTWGVDDGHTWLNNGPTHHRKQPNRPQRALLFDTVYQPKAAFAAVRSSLDNRT